MKLADYLTERKDIDPTRIGITGESLGGLLLLKIVCKSQVTYSVICAILLDFSFLGKNKFIATQVCMHGLLLLLTPAILWLPP